MRDLLQKQRDTVGSGAWKKKRKARYKFGSWLSSSTYLVPTTHTRDGTGGDWTLMIELISSILANVYRGSSRFNAIALPIASNLGFIRFTMCRCSAELVSTIQIQSTHHPHLTSEGGWGGNYDEGNICNVKMSSQSQ